MLSALVEGDVVVMTTAIATNDDKVGINAWFLEDSFK